MYIATSPIARRPPVRYVSRVYRVRVPLVFVRRGFGAVPLTTQQRLAAGLTAGASTGATTALATGSAIEGAVAGGLMAAAPFAGPAAPFLIAAAALIGPVASMFQGCGQNCVLTSQMANQAQAALEQLQTAYFTQPTHWASTQQATLGYMDQIFAWLRQACGNPAMGDAGAACIQQRLIRGNPAPWCPNPGGVGCDWITAYRDRVANDPDVVSDPSPVTAASSSVLPSLGVNLSGMIAGMSISDLLLPAALLAAALVVK